jgi:hypothetical protein
MEEKRYKIIYKGKTAQGRQVEEVKRNLASLLKLGNEKLEQLFSGKPVIIAKNVGYDSAMKCKATFETAGAICSVEKIKTEQSPTFHPQTDHHDVSKLNQSDIIVCPKCGFEQEKTEECGKCGIIISKYSGMEGGTPPAMLQRTTPLYFSVSKAKLVVMSIFTLGLYELYWFYKNWNHVKIRTRQKIRPFWRTIFSVFYCYSLFKTVQESADSHGGRKEINPGWLAVGYILLSITYKLPDPFWVVCLLTFLPLLPVQSTINSINAKVAPGADRNSNFSVKNIFVMIMGGLLLALATLGMTVDSSFLTSGGPSAWEEFYSEDGNFAVLFPGIPEEETESINTQVGPINRQTFVVENDGGQTTYLVMCINYPNGIVEAASYDLILDSVRDDLMAAYRGKVNKEELVQLDNYPGREFDFEGKRDNSLVFGNVMTFLIEQRLYLLMALGVDEEVDAEDVEKFFVSFESLN